SRGGRGSAQHTRRRPVPGPGLTASHSVHLSPGAARRPPNSSERPPARLEFIDRRGNRERRPPATRPEATSGPRTPGGPAMSTTVPSPVHPRTRAPDRVGLISAVAIPILGAVVLAAATAA